MKIIHLEWPCTRTVYAVACLPEKGVFIVRNICKTCVRYFLVHSLCKCSYRLARWPCAMSVILAFIVAFVSAFRYHSVHGTVSFLTNRFLSVTENRRLGFRRRRYGRLFLAIAGLLGWMLTKLKRVLINRVRQLLTELHENRIIRNVVRPGCGA